ncbi:bifunctional 2-polyprenyl-6-hydroxyphenol methylase/3-demethylubiquinol 3-O-methyltransferase UbiG [Streptomyces sp. VRA16 Mangrove soil]|uniref:class I SAM-dependent methyltransferase n=1 Tax=Streptomyces sp. VRA16 Mangrove soil TaxID=2817434 RepID=UPI001A9D28D9|nr:class I SAM-dependent methyltransferase [Streptomyces sp. VRA16 Mangrove soil]MBO1330161.1 class I SAM-dependent methyltransferase [Streptomyces sp. VRA16 Mangrove soil]
MSSDDTALMAEQMAYYRARASEYDNVYEHRADLRELLAVADRLPLTGDVLELACGTGQWTALLARRAASVTAVDASAETLAIARTRAAAPHVRFVQADLFEWQPPRRYDTVFFGFWLSHVPPARFPGFWRSVAASLAPGGRAVFVDDGPTEAANEELLTGESGHAALRRLQDGSAYRIVKVFHEAQSLTDQLAALGWSARVAPAAGHFLVGVASPIGASGPA